MYGHVPKNTPQCCKDCRHVIWDTECRPYIYMCGKGRIMPTRKQSCKLQELNYKAHVRLGLAPDDWNGGLRNCGK